jgi:hypothetical protein
MKKIMVSILAAVFLVGVLTIPAAAFGKKGGPDQAWKNQHQQLWRAHQREWREYDREWRAHQNDRRWREEHIRMWNDWYQWHRDNESVLNIRIAPNSHGEPRLDIDFRKQ